MNPQPGATSFFRTAAGAMILACAALSGCTTVPTHLPDLNVKVASTKNHITRNWNLTPAIRTAYLKAPALHTSYAPVPKAIAQRKVLLALPPKATIASLAALLSSDKIPTVVTSDTVANRALDIPGYQGKLSGLLDLLGAMNGISVSWSDGTLVIGSGVTMTASIPPADKLLKAVTGDLKSLGATGIVGSPSAGEVTFDVASSDVWGVKRYLRRVVSNSATVGLQVAVITVGLNQARDTGLDWSNLQFTVGRTLGLRNSSSSGNGMSPGLGTSPPVTSGPTNNPPSGNNQGNGNTGDNGRDSNGNSNDQDGNQDGTRLVRALNTTANMGAEFAGGKFGIGVADHAFNMQALFSLLSTYGVTQTTQNLVLRTLSGSQVKIRSGATVPYVSQVSLAGGGNSNNIFGGTQTQTVKTGLTLTITPRYDAITKRVTMDVNVQLKSIIGFLQLSAGAQLGSMSRPEVQDQSLETVARAAAGHTVVLGGILYDQLTDNRSTLPGLEKAPVGHLDKKVQRNALFIVIRPTITTYQFSDAERARIKDGDE